mmetsp:Transcript_10820/g.32279  ORF Transcript_10820/g.32279 Transcript_10820/m.32279 type:complete len:135 (-) Transcript_10820:100-504(-)|eukprot:CAMPEP_0119259216 /NCGR_PEP_ID=MMETSP1329-20130426/119_1 /TAXON_ID=114041 /ORGANISM="Genus nov. species nov., Strain RCC1024" /LENGTH=134 /DNA_ID=CAMNT_0007258581 /DNA_START=105 /DNA_END=509 /DNA_ORIENTATION=-
MAKLLVALMLASAAHAFAPQPAQRTLAAPLSAYVPDGLSAADWAKRQAAEKKAKTENKKLYKYGAPQVLGVGPYLERLAGRQTFFNDKNGNPRVGATGHEYAKVKFGDFTKEAFDAWKAGGGKAKPNVPTYKKF